MPSSGRSSGAPPAGRDDAGEGEGEASATHFPGTKEGFSESGAWLAAHRYSPLRGATPVSGRTTFGWQGNPVRRLDRTTGTAVTVPVGTRGNQEIAVADYPGGGGASTTWLAVVAVGDDEGEDVRNHVYAGPAPGP